MGTIEGMFHDDITFCPEQCDRKDCMRNSKNIRDKTVPLSITPNALMSVQSMNTQHDNNCSWAVHVGKNDGLLPD